ncbi:MAG TPA: sigma-70 family RNA polymerase sigma factor [Bryobacteraceae bacterium]|nr:sigma-70 family RNA polymerase sigma factor [Bryobacteraceae bacterium]
MIDQCLQGDQGAWEALVHTYKSLIYSLCSKYRSRDRDTGDLVQDVFIRIFQKLGQFSGDKASLKGWIIRITRNLMIIGGRGFIALTIHFPLAHVEMKTNMKPSRTLIQ